jgi:hypothetical protein
MELSAPGADIILRSGNAPTPVIINIGPRRKSFRLRIESRMLNIGFRPGLYHPAAQWGD